MKKVKTKKLDLVLGIVMSSLIMLSIAVSSFAYWESESGDFNIPTTGFNATEDEFTYYACIPNVVSQTGYDYYDLEDIPVDLVDRVTSLAAVRFEALTKTCYIPSYPSVTVGGVKFNYGGAKELPVIHVLNSLSNDEVSIDNGFSHVENLIIPETVTYIQTGAFVNSTSLTSLSFLGNEDNSGYVYYDEDEFPNVSEENLHFENQEHRSTLPYSLVNLGYKFTQFSSRLEYDNLHDYYYTYVITKEAISSQALITGTTPVDMDANSKYKITYDGTTLNVDKYEYKLAIPGQDEIGLVLNTSSSIEEYIIPETNNNLGTIRINNYPEIRVKEYIDGVENTDVESSFSLNLLNASYTSDNLNFEIKYAPSYVYESKHYYSDSSGELMDETTLTQISVEKVYFLNSVTASTSSSEDGEKVRTITIPDNNYLDLYIRAKYHNLETYYVDPSDPSGTNTYIKMDYDGGTYSYQFSSENAPSNVKTAYASEPEYLVPNSFKFYKGQYNVVKYPTYTSNATSEEEIKTELSNANYGTRRVYLDMTDSGLYEDDHYATDGEIKYYWYLVYWLNESKYNTFRVFYADKSSNIIIADVPSDAIKFKFARIPASSKIDDALKNDWSGVTNQNEGDLTFDAHFANNQNRIKWTSWYTNNNGFFTFTNDSNITETKYLLRNRNYLILENYGEVGTTKYIGIDENLGYGRKEIYSATEWKMEFTKYASYLDKSIQTIALPKDSVFSAKIINIKTGEYFANTYGIPDANGDLGFKAESLTSKDVTSSYFEDDGNGKIKVLKDCVVDFYLKVDYDSSTDTATTPNDFGWYFSIKSDTLTGFSRDIICDTNEENAIVANTGVNCTSNTKTFNMIYPVLNQNDVTPGKLIRNYSNTEFEEYYLYTDQAKLSGSYVISPYYEVERDFGGSNKTIYYSVINQNSPSGEFAVTDTNSRHDDLVLFSPNKDHGYGETYYAAFDEHDNLLTYLSFNQTQSNNEGYQCFSMIIPQALSDYQYVYIYQVDENGKKISEKYLNSETSLDQMRTTYNSVNNASVDPFEKNTLLYDYYLNVNGSIEYNTNNYGFSFKEDGLYNFDNVYIDNTKTYSIRNSSNTLITLSNESIPLDEQIIDGYYYSGLTLTNNNKFTLPSGYYNLEIKVSGSYYYLGYRYLGETNAYEETYYLHIYENEELVDIIKMNSTINTSNYFVDVVYTNDISFKIYDSVNMPVVDVDEQEINETLTYSGSNINQARIYFSNEYPYTTVVDEAEVTSKILISNLKGIELIFNFGNHPNKHNNAYYNIRYSPILYTPSEESFITQIQTKDITNNPTLNLITTSNEVETIYDEVYFETSNGTKFGGYVTTTKFNTIVEVVIGNDADGRITIPHPGRYYITYKEGEGITCSRVQLDDRFYLSLGNEIIATLDVNPSNPNYYEYVVEDYIILYESINLEEAILQVEDVNGNIMTSIEKVTLNDTSVTSIPEGVYSLTYSVDSSRREDDKYLVFTYLNFEDKASIDLVYYYPPLVEGVYSTNVVNKLVKEEGWEYTLIPYSQITKYVPQGSYFAGWTTTNSPTSSNLTIEYEDGQTIVIDQATAAGDTTVINLYPVYKDRATLHEVIWLSDLVFDSSSNIDFTLENLETSTITGVSYGEMDLTNYVEVSNNRVSIKSSLFERIGYIPEGIPLYVHLQSNIDQLNYSVRVLVPYPYYDNRVPVSSTYSSSFSSSAYDAATNVTSKTIESKVDDQIDWVVNNGIITATTPYGNVNETGTDLSLRIKATSSSNGSAIANSLFADVTSISFQMMVNNTPTKAGLYVKLLDVNGNELYSSELLKNSEKDEYYLKTVNISEEGVYFIKFEATTSGASDVFVHIDELTITSGLTSTYSSRFTKAEYDTTNYSTDSESLIESKLDTALDFTVFNARISPDNSYDESDYSLALRQNGSSNTGYVITTQKFNSIGTVSLNIYVAEGYTKIFVEVSVVDENGNAISGVISNKASKNETHTTVVYDLNCTQAGYLKINLRVEEPGANTTYNAYLDNLSIEF